MTDSNPTLTFADLPLPEALLSAVREIGYETPSPIQARAIPVLLEGRDLLGLAQTGTGKTAAFALPLLARVDVTQRTPQVLVLCPTRELAIQVAEAFQSYARGLSGFHVLALYGGQDMGRQLALLRRGAHVVVGTPGRVMDHMRRESLNLDNLVGLVLDEADEMLRMGFVDDIEWILEHTPEERQLALFSATMPRGIRDIANRHLNNPAEVRIEAATRTIDTIEQRYCFVHADRKLDALTRVLEVEEFDGLILFVRTKVAADELAERLEARGFEAAALHGDLNQQQREKVIERLKNGQLDIVVATDVAARGIDVERITHVVNYDIPYDVESYVHRIGRTGRAGRKGVAILFVTPREKRLLRTIEQSTRQVIAEMPVPSVQALAARRIDLFKQQLAEVIESEQLGFFHDLIRETATELGHSEGEIAAALAYLAQRESPLVVEEGDEAPFAPSGERGERGERRFADRDGPRREGRSFEDRAPRERRSRELPDGYVRYRIEVGRQHGANPREIVGAIANEGGIEGRQIGNIAIFDGFSTVDLPDGMPRDVEQQLARTRVRGQALKLRRFEGGAGEGFGGDAPRKRFTPRPRNEGPRRR